MDDRKCGSPAKKTPLPTVVLLISVAMATGQILKNDPKCLSRGGICAVADSCPEDKIVIDDEGEDFCGGFEANGVCCQSVPDNVETCHMNGGRCGDGEACKNVPNFGQLDCEEGKHCCLLIY